VVLDGVAIDLTDATPAQAAALSALLAQHRLSTRVRASSGSLVVPGLCNACLSDLPRGESSSLSQALQAYLRPVPALWPARALAQIMGSALAASALGARSATGWAIDELQQMEVLVLDLEELRQRYILEHVLSTPHLLPRLHSLMVIPWRRGFEDRPQARQTVQRALLELMRSAHERRRSMVVKVMGGAQHCTFRLLVAEGRKQVPDPDAIVLC
jgi:hypothetical protein